MYSVISNVELKDIDAVDSNINLICLVLVNISSTLNVWSPTNPSASEIVVPLNKSIAFNV